MQKSARRPSIVDVARQAGVSHKTVSRVINNEKYVAANLKERVEQAIVTLGYVPNMAARSIRGARHFTLGLIFQSNKGGQYLLEVQDAALRACREAGYHLIVETMPASAVGNRAEIEAQLASFKADGAILLPPLSDDAVLIDLLQAGNVAISRLAPVSLPGVGGEVIVDDAKATEQMVDHLWALGHRRIGFVVGNITHPSARQRMAAFVERIESMSGTVPEELVREGDFSAASGLRAGTELLDLPEPPTAIFASNDEMAAGVISAAHQRGLNLPDDLSVCGFDDSPVASLIWPALTTIHQPLAEMAQAAVKQLLQPSSPRRVELGLGLVVRQSTSTPRTTQP